MFDTKIAIILSEDLAVWQKLNVAAFLASGLVGANPELIGEPYEDADGQTYLPLVVQPMILLEAAPGRLRTIYSRALKREVPVSLYIDDMFATPHDAANRGAVRVHRQESMPVVGLGLRAARGVVDKVTKGSRLHP